jgi:ligand-binding sensor domain-containing protein
MGTMRLSQLFLAAMAFLLAGTLVQGQTISFSSQPTASGVVYQAYSYDAEATASDNSTLQYSLSYGPTGMNVGSTNGMVSWTPENEGTYPVEIRAALASNPSTYATQGWNLSVAEATDPFEISGSPGSQTLSGASATYSITITPNSGFSASVFLSAYSPTLPGATFTFSPAKVNAPYTDGSVMTATLTGEKVAGTHQIIIEGKNGPATARDTVTLTVAGRAAWQVFNTYNSSLPNNNITAIEVDHDGTGWVGTDEGLASYDGSSWTVYSALIDSLDSYEHRIAGIAIDSSNHVWILGERGGLAEYSGGTWTIHSKRVGAILTSNGGHKLAADATGNIWIAADMNLIKYDGTDFTSYPVNRLASVVVDHNGAVWMGDIYGTDLRKFDGTYWTIYTGKEIPIYNYRHRSLAVDLDGNVWFVDHNGVAEFVDGIPTGYPNNEIMYADTTTGFPGPQPSTMDFDVTGTAWVGNGSGDEYWYPDVYRGGLLRYDGTDYWYYTIGNSGLPHDNINVVRAAADQNLWVGTYGGGLAILDGTAPPGSLFNAPASVPLASSTLAQQHLTGLWPNPTRGRAIVDLDVPVAAHARLSVMNTLGEEVMVVLDNSIKAGHQQLTVDLKDLTAGSYFLRGEVGGAIEARPLVVTR